MRIICVPVIPLYEEAFGGAINNGGIIGNLTGDFIGNYVNDTTGDFMEHGGGGAIFNSGIDNTAFNVTIGDINGNFIRNYTTSSKFNQYGGAIQNMAAEIGDINGDFIENYNSVSGDGKVAKGGAIYNGAINTKKGSQIGDITGDFVGNYAESLDQASKSAKNLTMGIDELNILNDSKVS